MLMKNYKKYLQELKMREAYYSDCVENAEMTRSNSAESFRKTLEDIQSKILELENMRLLKKIIF